MMRSYLLGFLPILFLLLTPSSILACPFCSAQGQTMLGQSKQADMILFGTLSNRERKPGSLVEGSTDLNIESVILDHPARKGQKVLTIPRYLPPDPNLTKYLVFCDVLGGEIDPYYGLMVEKDSKLADYLKGALAVQDKPADQRLEYFYKYLNDADAGIANDALIEFGNADYKEFRPLAERVDPDLIVKWLRDDPPASRVGLYGSMLGHCGSAEHASELKKLLDQAKNKRRFTGIDGLLAGYVLIDPEQGWNYLTDWLGDDKQEFLLRYAGLRAVRFFWEYRPDVVGKKAMVEAATLLVDQSDIADMAIEDLRKWERFEVADKVLGLYDQESYALPIIQRAILKFALSMPADDKRAAKLLAKARADDPDRVADIEELLKLEQESRQALADGGD